MTARFVKRLAAEAAEPYRSVGRAAWHFARGKLGGDPVFAGLLAHGLIPDRARILDIGCGQGLLASWLLTAGAMQETGEWPAHWPAAPEPASIHGIDLMPRDVERARQALQRQPLYRQPLYRQPLLQSHGIAAFEATFAVADMCKCDFGQADTIVILDVLHYVGFDAQNDVLRRAREALSSGGTLILRVGDANGGLPFRFSTWVDQAVCFVRWRRRMPMTFRPLADWAAALTDLGFKVEMLPMNQGTPFANILLVGRLG